MTKLLLHICCAPCSAYSVPALRDEGFDITGYYYNPNIHPAGEYQRREEALQTWRKSAALDIHVPHYDCGEYLTAIPTAGRDRCTFCYELRLRTTAREAKRRDIGTFSTTLLYSIYQKHDLLRAVGERIAREEHVAFHYRDLRTGWQKGYDAYRPTGLYRQNYCGCIFSEKEKIDRRKKQKKKEKAG